MRPTGQVALDLGPPFEDGARSSSDFEEIPHPTSHNAYWPQQPPAHAAPREQLPLHYMSEEKARRRVVRGPGGDEGEFAATSEKGLDYDAFDDEGKDVYSKMKAAKGPISSGRPRRPPPTSAPFPRSASAARACMRSLRRASSTTSTTTRRRRPTP